MAIVKNSSLPHLNLPQISGFAWTSLASLRFVEDHLQHRGDNLVDAIAGAGAVTPSARRSPGRTPSSPGRVCKTTARG